MKASLLIITIFTFGCIPDMTPPKTVIKTLSLNDNEIEWFSYSSAYAIVPDCITILKNGNVDTICKATNIADIKLLTDQSLMIRFYGTPKMYDTPISLNLSLFKVVLDTTYTKP